MPDQPSDRSVKAHTITGASIVTGDNNSVHVTALTRIDLPPPESVDLAAEVAALKAILARLDLPRTRRLEGAVADMEAEAAKPPAERDPEEVVGIMELILGYVRKTQGYVQQFDELQGRVVAIASWAGPAGQRLLGLLGIGG